MRPKLMERREHKFVGRIDPGRCQEVSEKPTPRLSAGTSNE